MKVLVTGATGTVGAHVVRALRERGVDVRAFARREIPGVEVALGDFGDRGSLERALDGIDRLFLACANLPAQIEYEGAAIDAAAAAGIERVVKLSGPAPAVGSPLVFDDWHGRIEVHLARSGLDHVLLRPFAYMTNLLQHAGRDTIFAPAGQAAVGFVDPLDVGEAAAAALLAAAPERAYALTGPEAITFAQIAQDLSLALGRRVEYIAIPDEAARKEMLKAGLSPFVAEAIVAIHRAWRAGAMARTTDAVEALTGRPPRAFSHFAHDHAAFFKAAA